MAGIGWNRMKMTDWMAMAGAVSALVLTGEWGAENKLMDIATSRLNIITFKHLSVMTKVLNNITIGSYKLFSYFDYLFYKVMIC